MDHRGIGVFDSGLGGLTAVRELSRCLPQEDIIYFGDTGRVPYGNRSRETLVKYARQDVAFLNTFDLKAIVVACGTVSSTALDILQQESQVPVVGVVEPAGLAAVAATKNRKIGLIGTTASIKSGAYERVIGAAAPSAVVTAEACPLLVPLVENGRFLPGDSVTEQVCREYLAPMVEADVDTLVLGCTHYPLLREIIGNLMGPGVTLVDAGEQVAHHLASVLTQGNALNQSQPRGTRRFYVSDTVEGFSAAATLFLGEDVTETVEQVDISAF